ncbi:hypothetical protein LCGC14_1036620 [marine sediment metagenome]|uniref:Uncharacterized protein n=1 Tax=marine sediment metagenome TaxID=412755 RepID=A0A0F9NEM5_9ZZZZ
MRDKKNGLRIRVCHAQVGKKSEDIKRSDNNLKNEV